MSLLFRRRAILRAVAGELSASDERRLRTHLARCPACRDYYDRLTLTARALSAGADRTPDERNRELARLTEALGPRSSPPQRRFGAWVLVPAALAAAAVFAVLPSGVREDDVAFRGGDAGPTGTASLAVYASRRADGGHGPVRLVADLPGSGEARLSREDFVQFRPRCQRTPCHAVVVGVDASGNARVYLGGEASAGSVLLGDEHPPGVVTVHAVFSEAPFREEEVAGLARALAAGERISTRGEHVTGILVIDP